MTMEKEQRERIKSKKAFYTLGILLGSGGNGEVYEAVVQESFDAKMQVGNHYAIKRCNVKRFREDQREVRKERFIREIHTVQALQDTINGIVPVMDSNEAQDDDLWYSMPIANRYLFKNSGVAVIIKDSLLLATTLRQIHLADYTHRDIKPSNLMYYKNRVCLTDFGLALRKDEDHRLTRVDDILGPIGIRPPELQFVTDVEYDAQKADIYMLAKTIWSLVKRQEHGFYGEYRRDLDDIYLNPQEFGVKTFEPMHRLMEGATRHDFHKRIDLDQFIELLKEQQEIVSGEPADSMINALKTQEALTQAAFSQIPNRRAYNNRLGIIEILKATCGFSEVESYDKSDNTKMGTLKDVSTNAEGMVILSVGLADQLEIDCCLRIKEIELLTDQTTILIRSVPLGETKVEPVYTRLRDVPFFEENTVYIDGEHTFMIQLPGSGNMTGL